MKRNFFIIVICSFFIISCNNEKTISTFDLSKNDFREISLRSTDFVKNLRVVKLETNENSLVVPGDNIYPTDNYIFIYSFNKIIQFDYSGKFIREIARLGNGPHDINKLQNCIVDSKQEYLYLYELSKPNYIKVYDLKNDQFKEPVPLAFDKRHSAFHLINDSTFLCFPYVGADRQLCYVQDLHGNLIDKSAIPEITVGSSVLEQGLKVMTFENEWFYQGNGEDTVYNALSGEPVAVFFKGNNVTLDDVVSSGGEERLISIRGLFQTSKDYFFLKVIYDLKMNEGFSLSFTPNEIRYFVYNLKDKTVNEVKNIYIEPFDKLFEKDDMKNLFFNKAISLNHKKIVISVPDEEENEDNPTLYIGELY